MNNTTGHAHDATAWLQLARRLQKQQLQQLSQLGELASQLSALVHMLQCERGRRISIFARAACCIQRSVGREGRWLTSG
ncbi:Response regulator NasT [Klebsiella pneumoniae]|uniref:Response regulator NasT n=1 Tax=Klebsiella pneumoniae TaxID=573 RepID=A0A2X3C672_KLEPN|nr:Response regulator NasT [Klebsiella pneumoniae]